MINASTRAILLALIMAGPIFATVAEDAATQVPARSPLAEAPWAPPPSSENKPPGTFTEFQNFAFGTARYGQNATTCSVDASVDRLNEAIAGSDRTVACYEDAARSVVRLFYEGFESGCSGLPSGWTEETPTGRAPGWHLDCYDSAAFAAGRDTAIVASGRGSASLRDIASGGYPARLDSRLVTPVIDLRSVSGASVDSNVATDKALCEDAEAADARAAATNGTVAGACARAFAQGSLHAYLVDLRNTLARAFGGTGSVNEIGRKLPPAVPDEATDLPLTPEALGFGMVNLTFRHWWDWKNKDGGLVEIRYEQEDGTWSSWRNLEGDLVFETRVAWVDALQAAGCRPWMNIQDLTDSPETRKHVVPVVCGGYTGYWNEQLGDDELGVSDVDGDLAQPGLSFSALYSRFVENQATTGPNGRVGEPSDHVQDPRGYTGTSGDTAISKYTLNRFIGKRVQIGFHAVSHWEIPPANRGWFVDDVSVSALVPSRDVGILSIEAPRDGDVVNANHEAVTPQAVLKNFGRSTVERVNVSFEILAEDGTVVWGPYYSPTLLKLAPQESAVVAATTFWRTVEGAYELRVRTWVDVAVRPDGPTGHPQTDVNSKNDEDSILFTAKDVRELVPRIDLDAGSLQTDIGGQKSGRIVLENRGNVALSGTLHLFYSATDTSTTPPTRVGSLVPIVADHPIASIPYGKNVTSLGSAVNWHTFDWEWAQRVSATNVTPLDSGVYALVARFVPDPAHGALPVREVSTFVYIRSTPPAALIERFAVPTSTPYTVTDRTGAVEAVGWTEDGGPRWIPGGHVYNNDLVSKWEAPRPTAVQGQGMWIALADDCRRLDGEVQGDCIPRNTNLLDWYVLRKNLDPIAPDADSVVIQFATQGHFNYLAPDEQNPEVNRSRAFVRVMPRQMDAAIDAARASAEAAGLTADIPMEVLHVTGSAHPCGRLEKQKVAVAGEVFDIVVLVIERAHTWRTCTVTASMEDFAGRDLAVEWVLETDRSRLGNEARTRGGTSEPWCDFDALSSVATTTCPIVTPGTVGRWHLDAVSIRPAAGGVLLTPVLRDNAESVSASQAFFECTYLFGLKYSQDFPCRGWFVDIRPTSFASNWMVEKVADVDGTGSVLRYGYVPAGLAPGEADRYGIDAPKDADATPLVIGSVVGPPFRLGGFATPALTLSTKFMLYGERAVWNSDTLEERAPDGASVWIVYQQNGVEVRELLTPDGGYNARLFAGRAPGDQSSSFELKPSGLKISTSSTLRMHSHPYGALYDATPGPNIWNGVSNPDAEGQPQWMRPVFDLSKYATPAYAGLEFRIEIQVVAQSQIPSRSGFFRVDDVRIEERTAANDIAVKAITLPTPGRMIGPGTTQVIAAEISNTGLFDQVGVAVRYEIRDDNDVIVSEQTVVLGSTTLPGLLSSDPQRNRTVVFDRTWTPEVDGPYTLTIRTLLAESLRPFPDTNPTNDEIVIPITVQTIHSARVQPLLVLPTESLVTPFIAGVGIFRSFVVPVENVGTLPAVFEGDQLGEFRVEVTVRRESGVVVLTRSQPILRLDAGKTLMIEFRDAWKPETSGLYKVEYELITPAGWDSTPLDNVRAFKVMVFNEIIPAGDRSWSEMFRGDGAWRQDEERTGPDGWTFGGPYGNGAEGVLMLRELENLRSIRNLFLVLDHRYAFEEGYDAGLVEVSADGGLTWIPVPPRGGYPVTLSTASPLVDDPFSPIAAFSGGSLGWTSLDLNLGAVEELRRTVPLLTADFAARNPFADGTACNEAAGATATVDCMKVEPHDGNGMWFSDKYAMLCTRRFKMRLVDATGGELTTPRYDSPTITFPHNFDFSELPAPWTSKSLGLLGEEWCRAPWDAVLHEEPYASVDHPTARILRISLVTPQSIDSPGANFIQGPLLETTKTLSMSVPAIPADATSMSVSFYDWRAIGTTTRVREVSGITSYVGVPNPNAIEVVLCCDATGLPVPLVPRQPPSVADNYRDWTLNTFSLTDRIPELAGLSNLRLEFRHTVSTGYPLGVGWAEPGDTDSLSPHIGWGIDDVKVVVDGTELLENGAETPTHATGPVVSYTTNCFQSTARSQSSYRCQPLDTPSETKASGASAWRVEGGLLGNSVWTVENGVLKATPTGARTSRFGTFTPGVVVGDDSRAVIPLDLKSAVDDVRLTFDTTYKFSTFRGFDANGRLTPFPVSGGRVEISVDEGVTWIPLDPVAGASTSAAICPSVGGASHTPLGGFENDPQRNSLFGMCGRSIFGQAVTYPEIFRTIEYDLTAYATQEVLLGFRTFFTSAREAQGVTFPPAGPGADGWLIKNLVVNAAILDTRDVALRLRGGADGSVGDEGWDVRGLGLLGVKHSENLGVRVVPPTTGGLIGEGKRDFSVEVVNKGQVPSSGTRLGIWVNVTRPDGTRVVERDRVYGPAPLADFLACPETLPTLTDGKLAAESSYRVCRVSVPGGILDLDFFVDPENDYEITAVLVDDAYARESVIADNHHAVHISSASILGPSEIRVKSVVASPNTFDPAKGGAVEVAALLENFGLDAAQLADLTLTIEAPDGRTRVKPREGTESTRFGQPLERRTFRWTLTDADFTNLPAGIYRLTVTAATQQGPTLSHVSTMHVGESVQKDLGWQDHVDEYPLDNERDDAWYVSYETCLAAVRPWFIQKDSTAAYTNNTARHAFALPVQDTPPTSVGGGEGGGTPPTPNHCAVFYNDLAAPLYTLKGVEGPDGLSHLYLTFWSRHSFAPGTWGSIRVEQVRADGFRAYEGFTPWVLNITGETPDYSKGRFVPITIDVLEALRTFTAPSATDTNRVRNAEFAAIRVHFRAYGVVDRPWQIDDVSLAPLGATIGPAQNYPALDDTDKEYRFVVRNSGAFTESFALSVTDVVGGPAAIPAGWHVVLLDESDRVIWFNGATFTPPPPGCNPVAAPDGPAPPIVLDPGQSHVVRAKVCIPISESQAGRSNSVDLGITAATVSNPFQSVTAKLSLSYSYRERPNLVVTAANVRVDNADLPVDQPRVVSVTVLNAGPVDAVDVEVRVVDSMAAAYGYEPTPLGAVAGGEVPRVPFIPSGEARVATFLWTPSAVGEHNLTVTVDPADAIRELRESDNTVRVSLPIGKAEYPDLVVTVRAETLEPTRGVPIWVELQVKNVGGAPATGVSLTFKAGVTDLLIHRGLQANDFVARIAPGETFTLRREWSPSFPGHIRLIGTALPLAPVFERVETQEFDNFAVLNLLVRSKALDLALADGNVTAAPGGKTSVDLTVANFGETADEYALRVDAPTGVSSVLRNGTQQVNGVSLEPGANRTLRLELTAPLRLAAGVYDVNITGTSALSGATKTVTLRLRIASEWALSLEAAPLAADPGRIVVPVTVRNEGNSVDVATVNASGLSPGWIAESGAVTLAPFGVGIANLTLILPTAQAAGLHEVFLVVKDAAGAAANATLLLEVKEYEAITPTVTGTLRNVRAGHVLSLGVALENAGNVRGEAALAAKGPAGWTIQLGRSLAALEVGEQLAVPLTVVVPRGTEPGRYDLHIDVLGIRSNRSMTAQVVVTESDLKVADLTFTPRVNVAPGTLVQFNATIENSGAPARNVTVAFYVDDFLIGIEKVPLIGAANASAVGFRWYAQPGEHVLLVLVDPGDLVEESDEANNARIEVIRTLGEAGILSAARNAVPAAPALAGVVAVLAAALVVARGRKPS